MVGVGAWASAVVAAMGMVKHRAPGVSIGWLMFNGIAFFKSEKFTAGAAPYRKGFLISCAVFLASIMLLALVSTVRAR